MTDEQRAYKLYLFLRYYLWDETKTGNSATAAVCYRAENFWIYFCKVIIAVSSLTDAMLESFMNSFLTFIELADQNSITALADVFAEGNETLATALSTAFAELGLTLSYAASSAVIPVKTITFTELGAKVKIKINNIQITTKAKNELYYANEAKDILTFSNIPLEDVSDQVYRCGENNYWTYNSTSKVLTINGSGETYGAGVIYSGLAPYTIMNTSSADPTAATTMIVSADITKMKAHSCYRGDLSETQNSYTLNKLVFLHSNSDPITLDTYWFPAGKASGSTKPSFDIYTDNDTIKNYNYSTNVTVTFHSLSEWSG